MASPRNLLGAALAALLLSSNLAAQIRAPLNRALATREDLEAALAGGKGGPKLSDRDRQMLRRRLDEGDFERGDRLVLRVKGQEVLSDTFTVREGQVLSLPDMAPLSLHGVLRSELEDQIRAHVAKYVRDPEVQAAPLLRVGILGAVVRPGYYSVPAGMTIGDLPSVAGGLAADGDLGKAHILRDGKELWPKNDVRKAMANGASVDLLGLRGADEFSIGRRGNFGATLAIVTGIATLATTVILLSRN